MYKGKQREVKAVSYNVMIPGKAAHFLSYAGEHTGGHISRSEMHGM